MKKLTITVEDDVYAGLRKRIGTRRISRFLNDLAKPFVTADDLRAAYADMAKDRARERGALEWSEGLLADSSSD